LIRNGQSTVRVDQDPGLRQSDHLKVQQYAGEHNMNSESAQGYWRGGVAVSLKFPCKFNERLCRITGMSKTAYKKRVA